MFNKMISLVSSLVVFALSATAFADEHRDGGVQLSVSASMMVPSGKADCCTDNGDLFEIRPNVGLELGYRTTHFFFGGAADYSRGGVGKSLALNIDYNNQYNTVESDNTFRVGPVVRYYGSAYNSIVPWIGVGAGYESSVLGLRRDDARGVLKLNGFEFVRVELGADVVDNNSILSAGPFIGWSYGQYRQFNLNGTDYASSVDIHNWFTIGVKGTFSQ